MKELERNELMGVDGGMMYSYPGGASLSRDQLATGVGFIWGFIDGFFNFQ